MRKLFLLFLLLPLFQLYSHGAEYTVLSDRTLMIEARFDTGEPFSESQVMVFRPGEDEAAYTLQTDKEGIFYFTPDREGIWILQVRGTEGHGLRINLPVDSSMTAVLSGSGGFSLLQKLIMAGCVIWGAAGTALYFRKKR